VVVRELTYGLDSPAVFPVGRFGGSCQSRARDLPPAVIMVILRFAAFRLTVTALIGGCVAPNAHRPHHPGPVASLVFGLVGVFLAFGLRVDVLIGCRVR
jgi:hypothetical protein